MPGSEDKGSRRGDTGRAESAGASADSVDEAWRLFAAGRREEAAKRIEEILRIRPDTPSALHLRAAIALGEGRAEDALRDLEAAIAHRPGDARLRSDLGVARRARGDVEGAIAAYREAIAHDPECVEAHANLANVLREIGRIEEAFAAYRKAVELRPDFALAHNNLGKMEMDRGRLEAAALCFRRAIAARPAFAEAHANLAVLLRQAGNLGEALAHYGMALALAPNDGLRLQIAFAVPPIMTSREAVAATRRRLADNLAALERQPLSLADPLSEARMTGFFRTYHGENDVAFQKRLAALFRRAAPSLTYSAAHCAAPLQSPQGRRLRVGFVSTKLRDHTIGRLFRGLIARLPRERFHVTVFQILAADDPVARFIREQADEAVALPHGLHAVREAIAARRLDALVYTDIGMDPILYFLAFARLAPVQCVAWGHPETTGIDTIDYFVSSALIEPEDAETHYSERLIRLATMPPYYYRPEPPAGLTRAEFGLEESAHIYLCAQTLFKFHPDFDPILGDILRKDPEGVVVLIEGAFRNWTRLLQRRLRASLAGLADRIRFVPPRPHAEFLALLASADVVLDTPHFSGGNSSYEALAFGVPVVTLPGALMRSRVTYGLYRAMDYTECIADSAEEYVRIALALGTDRGYRRRVSDEIRARNAVLFEQDAAVAAWADFLTQAIEAATRRGVAAPVTPPAPPRR